MVKWVGSPKNKSSVAKSLMRQAVNLEVVSSNLTGRVVYYIFNKHLKI